MTGFEYFQLGAAILFILIAIYVIRSLRIIGTKLSTLLTTLKESEKRVANQIQDLHGSTQGIYAHALLDSVRDRRAKRFVLSFTSHPNRFATLEQLLPSITSQILKPTEIHLNIAREHMAQLPQSLRKKLKASGVKVFEVSDLGPGKKLIPTLRRTRLPIICIDDDLTFPADLTLQLMAQHLLFPTNIIASRAHRVGVTESGEMRQFKDWEHEFIQSAGPDPRLFATSGAGTLFPNGSLHSDATDEKTYRNLAFHTDDLWWYFQARRIGTEVRRIPGRRALTFIPGTQEDGLWMTGNKGRNEENLTALIAQYGNPVVMSVAR